MSWQTLQRNKLLKVKNETKKLGLPKFEEGKKVRGGGNNYANMLDEVEYNTPRKVDTL
jgi:hypothetical protein